MYSEKTYLDVVQLLADKEKIPESIPNSVTDYQKEKLLCRAYDEFHRREKQIKHIVFSGIVTNVSFHSGNYNTDYISYLEVNIIEDLTKNEVTCRLIVTYSKPHSLVTKIKADSLAKKLSLGDHITCRSASLQRQYLTRILNPSWSSSTIYINSFLKS